MKRLLIGLLLAQPAAAADLYLQGGLSLQGRHGACVLPVCAWDRNDYAPWLGHLEIGVEQRFGHFTGSLFARHESLTQVHDYGVNEVGLQLRLTLRIP